MPSGGARDEWFAADYNSWSVENIERHPDVRDLALFVGEPEDVVDRCFGPGLPQIDEWVRDHYDFCGYITGFEPAELADRAALRAELGWVRTKPSSSPLGLGGSGSGRRVAVPRPPRHTGLRREKVDGLRDRRGDRACGIDPAALPKRSAPCSEAAGTGTRQSSNVRRGRERTFAPPLGRRVGVP